MKSVFIVLFFCFCHVCSSTEIYNQYEVNCNENYTYCKDDKGNLLNGEIHFKYSNKTFQIIPYSEGKINGLFKNYFTDKGTIYQEIFFIDGVPDGLYKTYYASGKLFMVSPYNKGVINGEIKLYNENGSVLLNIEVKQGKVIKGKCNKIPLSLKDVEKLNNKLSIDCGEIKFTL